MTELIGIQERLEKKAKDNLDKQILKCAKPLLDFISSELSGNPRLSEFLQSVQHIEEGLSTQLTEEWTQRAIDNFVGYNAPKDSRSTTEDNDSNIIKEKQHEQTK